MKQRLVVVGSGMASGRLLEHLFAQVPDAFDVTLFGAEPRGNYNRIMLSPVLAGEERYEEIITHDAAWYASHGISCRFGETVTRIDRRRKAVYSRNGETPYDKLVIATGSAPFILPIAGKDLRGVLTFRDLDDVNAMIAAAEKPDGKAVVIGGGLLGLEAAAALRKRGMEVVLLHLMGHLMELQLDPAAGGMLRKEMERRGIKVHCHAQTTAILGHRCAEAVLLDDGTIYPADLVVMAAGVRPETRIATGARLDVERGVVVDEMMRSSDPDILAVGECAEFDSRCYGFVEPLYEMAAVAAKTLIGVEASFDPVQHATNLKISGVNVFSAGEIGAKGEEIVLTDPGVGTYKRFIIRDDRLTGAVLYGDTGDGLWYLDLIRSGASVAPIRGDLAFGRAFVMQDAA
jgi:nitrite reductase (NADH) large subunit